MKENDIVDIEAKCDGCRWGLTCPLRKGAIFEGYMNNQIETCPHYLQDGRDWD
jgi:hypothetical protein